VEITMPHNATVEPTPTEVFAEIEADGQKVGGPWARPAEYEGCVGVTMFDSGSSQDGTVTVLLPKDSIDLLPSQALVRILSLPDNREYLAAVVAGPFAEPDGLSADATPIVASTVRGGLLMPPFHGRAQLSLIGERLKSGTIVPPRRRSRPNSPVFVLTATRPPRSCGLVETSASAWRTGSTTSRSEFHPTARRCFLAT
jgi:hypothetical protein